MDFNQTYAKMLEIKEAMTPEEQRKADMKKKAIAAAKAKNQSLANVPDEELDYDEATNTVKKMKLNAGDLAKAKNVKIKV